MALKKFIPVERLMELHEALIRCQHYSKERRMEILKAAQEYKLSEYTVRRQYQNWMSLTLKGRCDKGTSKIASKEELEHWITMLAAVQLATRNKKGHMCSTRRAIELLEAGIICEDKPFQLPAGKLTIPTANRWLRTLRVRHGNKYRQFVPVHFRAEYSNQLWQADVSPSDAKYFGDRMRRDGRKPYLYAVTDDHSGVVYAEYRETRDEDIQAGLEVLYAAMAKKKAPEFLFQGIPECFYFDPGRIGASSLVKRVLEEKLGSKVRVHQSDSAVGKFKKAARAKGKIERQFHFLKDDFESLFHFHRPESVEQANDWLFKYLLKFNSRPHPEINIEGSRIEIWAKDLPTKGFRDVCSSDIFWSYVAEPETHIVGPDARLIIGNKTVYVVNSDLAGEAVEYWYVGSNEEIKVKDNQGKVYGPYSPVLRPIPSGEFRRHKKTQLDKMMERIESLSEQISIPQESIYGKDQKLGKETDVQIRFEPFSGPEPFKQRELKSIREFYQVFYDWFKQPIVALSEQVQSELETLYEQSKDPDELWKQCQAVLRKYNCVR